MADALTFTIYLPDGKYASVNRTNRSWRDPRKSPIYQAVFNAVLEAAKVESERIGWETAECECFASVMRIMPARWRADAMNMGKPELDALTEAKIWTDDRLANPCLPWIRYDEDGPHRVTIVVMKLYEPANVRIVGRPIKRTKSLESTDNRIRIPSPEKVLPYTGGPIPDGYALVNGSLVSRAEALSLIQK